MSLTSFLEDKEVKQKFKETFRMPKLDFNKEIKLQPATKNFTIMGIAFDYLFRCYIKKLNNMSDYIALKAENVVRILNSNQRAECLTLIRMTKQAMDEYFSINGINNELLILLLQISHYDIVYRTGRVDYLPGDIGKVNTNDVIDLKRLYNLLQDEKWKCKNTCLLNPVFGDASLLVNGADADLIMDDMLIDIKVTTQPGITREFYNQLIGYYILNRIVSLQNNNRNMISRLGVYSARYGELISFDVNGVINENAFNDFCRWFIEKAGKFYNHPGDFISKLLSYF